MHYSDEYVVSSNSKLTEEEIMRFRNLFRRRRLPKPTFYRLELDLSFDEILADLVYPGPSLG